MGAPRRSKINIASRPVKSKVATCRISTGYRLPATCYLLPFLRLDESVVPVLTLVKHAETVGIGIAEDQELIGFAG